MKLTDVITVGLATAIFSAVACVALRNSPVAGQVGITTDLVRNRVIANATLQYAADNHNKVPPTQWGQNFTVTGPVPNRVWGQLILPYHGNIVNNRDPDHHVSIAELLSDLPDCTNLPLQCEFNFGIKSHRGYNFQMLAPLCGIPLHSPTLRLDQVANPRKALLFIDSIWDRTQSGEPRGGGNWIVDPPARRTTAGVDTFPTFPGCSGRSNLGGWNPSRPNAWNVYGGTWPWHKNQTAVVSFLDGHVATLAPGQLSAGTTVLDNWGGRIFDREAYLWDME